VSAVFIAGTGTNIGKTFVTAALIHTLRHSEKPVDALKPVVSGFDPAQPGSSDPGILLTALGQPTTIATLDRIAPWRFAAPLSPDMAARREGTALDFAALLRFTRGKIETASGTLLIEGVGGIMVPLDETHTTLDWMAALDLPVLLVAGSYLGALSHALTAFAALGQRQLRILAVVVNESPGSGVDLAETVATLRRFVPQPTEIVALPRLPSAEAPHPALHRIADLL
jgi:dethiobiotin synthetase